MKSLKNYFNTLETNEDKIISNKKTKTLFLTRNGLLEPLGQSQVMPYLRGLSKHYKISLISYEKIQDLSNKALMNTTHIYCTRHNIRWLPQEFLSNQNFIVQVASILRMIWLVKKEVNREGIFLIHARSYIPAFVAFIVKFLTDVPFIFDMRALWPEELITAGRIRRDSWIHLAMVRAEKSILKESAAVVSLTNSAVHYLKSKYLTELKNQRIIVIPTCADLKRFTPVVKKYRKYKVHGCIGTILSGWFRVDFLSKWIRLVALLDPNSRFEILTRDDVKKVRKILDPKNELVNRLGVSTVFSKDMPDAIRAHDLSLMFFTKGLGKLGSAPTRLAEALGSGIPIVVNKGVGDIDNILKKNNVGVLVKGYSKKHMEDAFEKLQNLLKDPKLSARCRSTAQSIFSLDKGTKAYRKIYKEILDRKSI